MTIVTTAEGTPLYDKNGEPITTEALDVMIATNTGDGGAEPHNPTDAERERIRNGPYGRNRPGRPPLGDTPSVMLHLRVPGSLKTKLDAAAKARGVKPAAYAREMLEEALR